MIREELLHPALSHFPIACLVLVVFTKLTQLIVIKKYPELEQNLTFTHRFLLLIGCAMLLPTMFLGDMALDIVKGNLCNLVKAYQHEELGQITLIIFIIALAGEVLIISEKIKRNLIYFVHIFVFGFILLGNTYLFQTAHTGANLVYEQGAGLLNANTYKCKK